MVERSWLTRLAAFDAEVGRVLHQLKGADVVETPSHFSETSFFRKRMGGVQ